MTVAEAAAKLGLPERTIRRWCQIGKLSATKEAGEWIIEFPTPPPTPSETATLTEFTATLTEPLTEALSQLESRLSHLEGAFLGQLAAILTEKVDSLTGEMQRLREELAESRKREEELLRLARNQAQPWWKRWRSGK